MFPQDLIRDKQFTELIYHLRLWITGLISDSEGLSWTSINTHNRFSITAHDPSSQCTWIMELISKTCWKGLNPFFKIPNSLPFSQWPTDDGFTACPNGLLAHIAITPPNQTDKGCPWTGGSVVHHTRAALMLLLGELLWRYEKKLVKSTGV